MELNHISLEFFEHPRELWLGYLIACYFIFDTAKGYGTLLIFFFNKTVLLKWSLFTRLHRLQTCSAPLRGLEGKNIYASLLHTHMPESTTNWA